MLDAGRIFDIRPGDEFEIFEEISDSKEARRLCSLPIIDVKEDWSLFAKPDVLDSTIPDRFYARRTSLPRIKFHASDIGTKLHEISPAFDDSVSDFASRVDTEADAELLISFEDGSAHFFWGSKSVVSFHVPKLPIGRPVPMSDKAMIVHIVRAAAHFHHYLQVGEPQGRLRLELRRLEEQYAIVDDIPMEHWGPSGENVLHEDVAHITVASGSKEGPFGISISNFLRTNLCPHVFWFHPRTLKIREYFTLPQSH